METKKNVLIITDGAASTGTVAEQISAELKDCRTQVRTAADFSGTDILPAEVFFLGCEEPNPPSFNYLAELLGHINLAGRSCGVFSPQSPQAAAYLAGLVRDCEASLGTPFVAAEQGAGLKQWVRSVF